jgi:hypothetical protein
MFRAVIGTIAVLAGFAVVERTSDLGAGPAGSFRATEAYALLRPGESVPVRASPTPEGVILGTLALREAAEADLPVVTLTGSKQGWARIALDTHDYTAIDTKTHAYGWVPSDLLAVGTPQEGTVTIYDRPGLLGDPVGRIENKGQTFRVLGCHGTLLQVINAKEGNIWIDRWCAGAACRR